MTVTVPTFRTIWFTANGVNKNWSYAFPIPGEEYVVVEVQDSTGFVYRNTANFTLHATDEDTGYVSFPDAGAAVAAGSFVRIVREIPFTQPTRIGAQGAFLPEIHEAAFDRLTMMVQPVFDRARRAVKVEEGETEQMLPMPDNTKVIGWIDGELANIIHSGADTEAAAAAAALSAAQADSHKLAAQFAKTSAETARDSAWQAQTAASAAAAQAEQAATLALVEGSIYPDTTAGLAAVAEGAYFFVAPATVGDAFLLYRKTGGVAVAAGTYPSAAQLQAALDESAALAALFPRAEYSGLIYNDNASIIPLGGYPLVRYATEVRTFDHVFVEIINGAAESTVTINIRINGVAEYPPTTVVQGTPLDDDTIPLAVAVGDEIRVEVTAVTGTVYGLWVQLDGAIA